MILVDDDCSLEMLKRGQLYDVVQERIPVSQCSCKETVFIHISVGAKVHKALLMLAACGSASGLNVVRNGDGNFIMHYLVECGESCQSTSYF